MELMVTKIMRQYILYKVSKVHILVQKMENNDDYAVQFELFKVAKEFRDIKLIWQTIAPGKLGDLLPPVHAYIIIELETRQKQNKRTCIFMDKGSFGVDVNVFTVEESIEFPKD